MHLFLTLSRLVYYLPYCLQLIVTLNKFLWSRDTKSSYLITIRYWLAELCFWHKNILCRYFTTFTINTIVYICTVHWDCRFSGTRIILFLCTKTLYIYSNLCTMIDTYTVKDQWPWNDNKFVIKIESFKSNSVFECFINSVKILVI